MKNWILNIFFLGDDWMRAANILGYFLEKVPLSKKHNFVWIPAGHVWKVTASGVAFVWPRFFKSDLIWTQGQIRWPRPDPDHSTRLGQFKLGFGSDFLGLNTGQERLFHFTYLWFTNSKVSCKLVSWKWKLFCAWNVEISNITISQLV